MKVSVTLTFEVPYSVALDMLPEGEGSGGVYYPGRDVRDLGAGETTADCAALDPYDPTSRVFQREATSSESVKRRDANRFDEEFS